MSEEKVKPTQAELDEAFNFGDQTIQQTEEAALLEAKEYDLEIDKFVRAGKKLTEENMSDNDRKNGETPGTVIPYVSIKLKHAKNKDGKVDQSLMGRRHDGFFWDLRREDVRDDLAKFYRAMGYAGTYVPKYQESEFITQDENGKKVGRVGRFYISVYTDSKTKTKKNGNPKPVVLSEATQKAAVADAKKGDVEL